MADGGTGPLILRTDEERRLWIVAYSKTVSVYAHREQRERVADDAIDALRKRLPEIVPQSQECGLYPLMFWPLILISGVVSVAASLARCFV